MKLSKKLENMFSAIGFAEEGEFETARQMVAEGTDTPHRKPAVDEVKLGTPRIKQGQLAPKA
ncbi:MAG: hypothetical protein WC828_04815 [Thermoleophilia bacterium]|jgi:hypothetical protein